MYYSPSSVKHINAGFMQRYSPFPREAFMPINLLLRMSWLILFALAGCAKGGIPDTPENVSLIEGIPYCTGSVDGVQQPLLLDVARPKDQKKSLPVVLVVHGGGWTEGSRADYRYMLNWLAQQNFIGVSVDYRLSPKNKFPDQLEDLKCAARWLRANEVLYRFDTRRIAAIGASAGAHLVALLGTTAGMSQFEGVGGHQLYQSSIDAMVLHAGVYDLRALVRELAANPTPESRGGIQAVSMLLGGNGDTNSQAYVVASPASYVSKQTVPALLLHGRNDSLVPFTEAVRFGSLLTGLGLDNEVVIMNGAGHGDFGSDPGQVILKLLTFLNAQTQRH
jgi:acetyl esterase/lipase